MVSEQFGITGEKSGLIHFTNRFLKPVCVLKHSVALRSNFSQVINGSRARKKMRHGLQVETWPLYKWREIKEW